MSHSDLAMTDPIDRQRHPWPAPCRGARRLLATAVIVSGLCALVAAAGILHGISDQPETAATWMRALTLSAPAMWTAGSPMRHPEMSHPGVDLRFSIHRELAP